SRSRRREPRPRRRSCRCGRRRRLGFRSESSASSARAPATAAARRLAAEGFAAAARPTGTISRACIGTPAGAARAAERLIARLPGRTPAFGRAVTVVDELVRTRFALLERAARTVIVPSTFTLARTSARFEGLGMLEFRLGLGPALLAGGLAELGAFFRSRLGGADTAGLARRVRHGRAGLAAHDRRAGAAAGNGRGRLDRGAGRQVLG